MPTVLAVESVSPKPSKSSSSSFSPCQVIAGRTTSGRPPDGPAWTATGTLARSPAGLDAEHVQAGARSRGDSDPEPRAAS